MKACVRGPAPPLLAQHGPELTDQYVARRAADPAHRFRWPVRDGRSLLDEVRDALRLMTQGHCAYCDVHPVDAAGEEHVDHFQPRSRFPQLAFAWGNLFFTCVGCNRSKADRWDPRLLRPDAEDFSFRRYFEYHFDDGSLAPNPLASADDQARARYTLDVLKLNRAGACVARQTTGVILHSQLDVDEWRIAYRYLMDIPRRR